MPDHPLPALQVDGLTKAYGPRTVLAGVTLSIGEGRTAAVIGPSGSGKSTLLRCIAGLERPDAGRVVVGGRDRPPLDQFWFRPNPEARTVGMVFQDYNLWSTMSALNNLVLPLVRVCGLGRSEARKRAEEAAGRFGLQALLSRMPGQLSGGEKQRFALLRSVLLRPRLILLDEVTAALDVETRWTVFEMLGQIAAGGATLLIVSHELPFVKKVADETIFLKDGQVVEAGETASLLVTPRTDALQAFLRRLDLPDREAKPQAAVVSG